MAQEGSFCLLWPLWIKYIELITDDELRNLYTWHFYEELEHGLQYVDEYLNIYKKLKQYPFEKMKYTLRQFISHTNGCINRLKLYFKYLKMYPKHAIQSESLAVIMLCMLPYRDIMIYIFLLKGKYPSQNIIYSYLDDYKKSIKREKDREHLEYILNKD